MLAAIGFGMLSRVDETTSPTALATACFTYALGLAPVLNLSTALIVGSAPPEQAGAASAISETSSEFGGALGIALLGSLVTAVYRVVLIGDMPPGTLMDAASSSLGATMQEANRIGGVLGATLIEVSREAFVQGLRAAATVCAIVLVVTALLAARWLLPSKRMGDAATGK